jgi:AcrR family transcriptional regulator
MKPQPSRTRVRAAAERRARGRPPTAGLRERILRAAEAAFLHQEFHEVLMDDVARASGVGKGTLYRYFPSKRALYHALLIDGMDQLRQELETAAAAPDEPVVKLARLVRCFLEHFWHRRFLLALMHRNDQLPGRGEWRQRRAAFAAAFEAALGEGLASGQLRPVEPRLAASVLVGMLRGADLARSPQDRIDELVELIVGLFLAGAGSDAGRRTWAARQRRKR